MKKVLPFEPCKEMTSYPFYSDYLGVLNAHGYDISNILFNNFMTLYYTPGINQIGFRKFDYLKGLFTCEDFIINHDDPIRSVCEKIDDNKYVEVVLNCEQLPFVKTKNYTYHDWFIYGYDNEAEQFSVAGYITESPNIFFKYKQISISYDDFLKAVPGPNVKTGFEKNTMCNHAFSLPQNFKVEDINYRKISFDLFCYTIPFPPVYFNIAVYNRYIKYLNDNIDSLKWFDLRNLVTINDHKKIIYNFACKHFKDDPIVEEIKAKIVAQSDLLLHFAIKYNLTHKKSTITDIISLFKQLSENEKDILSRLRKKL